jgi:hypothetical protein
MHSERLVTTTERFYIDCEFDGHAGPLLSIAVVDDSGVGVHVQTPEIAKDPWVIENVVPKMHAGRGEHVYCSVAEVGDRIKRFIGDVSHPVIIADSPVDIGRFCSAISTAPDGGWASTGYPNMTFEVHNVDCYPTALIGAVQHNAWWDAMALREKMKDEA